MQTDNAKHIGKALFGYDFDENVLFLFRKQLFLTPDLCFALFYCIKLRFPPKCLPNLHEDMIFAKTL